MSLYCIMCLLVTSRLTFHPGPGIRDLESQTGLFYDLRIFTALQFLSNFVIDFFRFRWSHPGYQIGWLKPEPVIARILKLHRFCWNSCNFLILPCIHNPAHMFYYTISILPHAILAPALCVEFSTLGLPPPPYGKKCGNFSRFFSLQGTPKNMV